MKKLLILLLCLTWQVARSQDKLRINDGDFDVEIIQITREVVLFRYWGDEIQAVQSVPRKQVSKIRLDPAKLTARKWSIGLAIGGNLGGNKSELEDLLTRQEFNRTSYRTIDGFFGPIIFSTEHPISSVAPSVVFDAEYLRKPNQGLGLSIAFSNGGTVGGFHPNFGHLLLKYGSISFSPVYSIYDRWHTFRFSIGPSVRLLSVSRTGSVAPGYQLSQQRELRPGAYIDVSFALWEKPHYYCRITGKYLWHSGKLTFGPYEEEEDPDNTYPGEKSFHEESMNFSHGMLGLQMGLKI